MSDIEQSVIPIMAPMVAGESRHIGPNEQEKIARWCALKTIIGEFDDLEYSAITKEEHARFYSIKKPLDSWRIWIGHYSGEKWRARYQHSGLTAVEKAALIAVEKAAVQPDKCNLQVSTFVGGQLLIHTLSSALPQIANFQFDFSLAPLLRRIWPPSPSFGWPIVPTITDADASAIHLAMLFSLMPRR